MTYQALREYCLRIGNFHHDEKMSCQQILKEILKHQFGEIAAVQMARYLAQYADEQASQPPVLVEGVMEVNDIEIRLFELGLNGMDKVRVSVRKV